MDLAASKIAVDPSLAPNFEKHAYSTRRDFAEWLDIVRDKAVRAGVPLRAELLGMVHSPHDELRHEAERESLGLNRARLHPDVYMNELLCGMRAIHQVLPVIMNKLGIAEEDFNLDTSEFYVK